MEVGQFVVIESEQVQQSHMKVADRMNDVGSVGAQIVGGLIAGWIPLGRRTLGAIMGFGAGVLISAVSYRYRQCIGV